MFGWSLTKFLPFKHTSKFMQKSLTARERPQKSIETLNIFITFALFSESRHATTITLNGSKIKYFCKFSRIWKKWEGEESTGRENSLYVFRGDSFLIMEVSMNFEPFLKVQNSFTIHLNITKLGNVANFNVVVEVMWLFSIRLNLQVDQVSRSKSKCAINI